jgi:aspartyl-tRNA(Asn)/glutamyl-tRNA(Gln) amidotransferase subunit B
LVNFNRAGVPLMELVTEPDIKTPEEAVNFAENLQAILRYLDVSSSDMEKGQMRIEVNISLSSSSELGTKVEIKNINSFRAVYEAIKYEIKRQTEILEKGGKIVQETRGWDDVRKITVSQRFKETEHDYRYFPEPDLPPFNVEEIFDLEKIRRSIPELPLEKKERFKNEYQLGEKVINILVQDKKMADYFEEAVSELKAKSKDADIKILANYLVNDILGILKERNESFENLKVLPEHLAHLVYLIYEGKISSRIAKDMLSQMIEKGEDPENLMLSQNIKLISNEEELKEIAQKVISQNEKAIEDYKKGKENALQFLVGKIMQETKGKANPEAVKEILKEILK